MIIVASWTNKFQNWEYTVLSRVRTLKGLFLLKDIDMDKSFAPSKMLKEYFKKIRHMESTFLNERKQNMKKFYAQKRSPL